MSTVDVVGVVTAGATRLARLAEEAESAAHALGGLRTRLTEAGERQAGVLDALRQRSEGALGRLEQHAEEVEAAIARGAEAFDGLAQHLESVRTGLEGRLGELQARAGALAEGVAQHGRALDDLAHRAEASVRALTDRATAAHDQLHGAGEQLGSTLGGEGLQRVAEVQGRLTHQAQDLAQRLQGAALASLEHKAHDLVGSLNALQERARASITQLQGSLETQAEALVRGLVGQQGREVLDLVHRAHAVTGKIGQVAGEVEAHERTISELMHTMGLALHTTQTGFDVTLGSLNKLHDAMRDLLG